MIRATNIITIIVLLCSLTLVDYTLGNGLLNIILRFGCRLVCFVRKVIRDEAKNLLAENSLPINLPVLVSEAFFLTVITMVLKKLSKAKSRDRIDELLEESRHRLRCTNDYLNKWRRRRILTEHSYLDEEPHAIAPFKLEIPILYMAIIGVSLVFDALLLISLSNKILEYYPTLGGNNQTRGSNSTQHERGDASDSINDDETFLLSMTSLVDDDSESLVDSGEGQVDEAQAEKRNRVLWNVLEEKTIDC